MLCKYPLTIKNPNYKESTPWVDKFIQVPCGKCSHCLINKQNEWIGRLILEYLYSKKTFFLTLTYDNDHLPLGYTTDKRDVVLFLKRFRKQIPVRSLRYFFVSEYGRQSARPHYHALLFFNYDITHAQVLKILDKVWHSRFQISSFTLARARYCVKYLFKSIGKASDRTSSSDSEDDREELSESKGSIRFDRKSGQNYFEETGEVVRLGGFSLKSQSLGRDYLSNIQFNLLKEPYYTKNGKRYKIPRSFYKYFSKEQLDYFKKNSRLYLENINEESLPSHDVHDELYERQMRLYSMQGKL